MHDYVIKKFLLIVGGFCILNRIHFVSPCQPLAIRQEDMVVLSYDGFCHAKSEGGNDKYCFCMAASSSLSSSMERWGATV